MRNDRRVTDPRPPAPSLVEELRILGARKGELKALARKTPSTSAQQHEDAHLSHAHLSRILDPASGKALGGDLALRLERVLGHPAGSFVETRAELLRQALTDGELVNHLWEALQKHSRRRHAP